MRIPRVDSYSDIRLRRCTTLEFSVVVTIIHKFDDVPVDINTRENVFVLVDEAHRTTGGELGNYRMGALPNATYTGFTGTSRMATRTVTAAKSWNR